MVILSTALLNQWQPWGRGDLEASEARLLHILEEVMWKGIAVQGVEIKVGKALVTCVEEVLTSGPIGDRRNRFGLVLMLQEAGCLLRFDAGVGSSCSSGGG